MLKKLSPFLLTSLIFLSFCLPLEARDRTVESADRLNLLNQATGNTDSASNSFQARLDAIVNTAPTPERTLVANDDEAARQQFAVQTKIMEEKTAKRASDLNPAKYDPSKNKDNTKIADDSKSKVIGTEEAYLKEREDIQKESDEKLKKMAEANLKLAKPKLSPDAIPDDGLSKNPFYSGKTFAEEQHTFEESKPILVSRLVSLGMAQDSAVQYVSQSSSNEDLILILMRQEAMSYGQASNLVGSTASSNSNSEDSY